MVNEDYKTNIKGIYKAYINGKIDSEEARKQIIEELPELKKVNFHIEGKLTLEAVIDKVPVRISLPYNGAKRKVRKRVVELVSDLNEYTSRYFKNDRTNSRNKIHLGKFNSTKHKTSSLFNTI